MKVLIENYRGWEISFDTEKESFCCYSSNYDRDEKRQSFASTKKWIDDFLKENKTFKPFWVESKPNMLNSGKLKIIGIRKDGKFLYEGKNGEKAQLSLYNEKDFILYNPENEKFKLEASELREQIEVLRQKISEALNKMDFVELSEYKKQLGYID